MIVMMIRVTIYILSLGGCRASGYHTKRFLNFANKGTNSRVSQRERQHLIFPFLRICLPTASPRLRARQEQLPIPALPGNAKHAVESDASFLLTIINYGLRNSCRFSPCPQQIHDPFEPDGLAHGRKCFLLTCDPGFPRTFPCVFRMRRTGRGFLLYSEILASAAMSDDKEWLYSERELRSVR